LGDYLLRERKLCPALLENIELESGGERFEVPDEMPQKSKEPLYINNSSVSNLYFIIDTFIKRRITDDESDALKLANMMLTETLHSKILGTARERGLVYGMGSGQSLTLWVVLIGGLVLRLCQKTRPSYSKLLFGN
jgi:hypothetical protein